MAADRCFVVCAVKFLPPTRLKVSQPRPIAVNSPLLVAGLSFDLKACTSPTVTLVYRLIASVQAMRSEGRDIDIGRMMDRWTLQMGYPVVTISKNQSEQLLTHYISVSQEHFLYGQEVGNNYRYSLPSAGDVCVLPMLWDCGGAVALCVIFSFPQYSCFHVR